MRGDAMLLRRMMQHVESQNWFAVGLDFFIVVAGVAFAFQLTTWGEQAADKARAEQSLRQLYEEAEEVLAEWTGEVRRNDETLELQDRVIAALNAGDQGDLTNRELARALGGITHFPTLSPPRRVYDELRSAGLLREIDAPEALDAVSNYYVGLDFIQGQIIFFRPDSIDHQSLRYGQGVNSYYDSTRVVRQRIEVEFDVLAADPIYLDTVSGLLRNRLVFQFFRRRSMYRAAEMCQALAAAVGESCTGYPAYEEIEDLPEWQMRDVPPDPDDEED